MGKPKVVAVIPIYRREAMAIETVRMLRHQTVAVIPILVGSGPREAAVAKALGCEYVQYPNTTLSSKWQVGVWRAGDINPNAVMILGSDTWLTPDWCAVGLKTMRAKECDVVGRNDLYIMHLTRKGQRVIHRGYTGPRAMQPAGPGRMISREGMRALGWVLFRERKSKHCDGVAMRAIRAAGLRCRLMPRSEEILTITADEWPSKHTFADVLASKGLREMRDPPAGWVADTYPGAGKAIARLREATW